MSPYGGNSGEWAGGTALRLKIEQLLLSLPVRRRFQLLVWYHSYQTSYRPFESHISSKFFRLLHSTLPPYYDSPYDEADTDAFCKN